MLKFVHASDLHLDSPFKTMEVQDAFVAKQFREATLASFIKIVDLCIKESADFLLIAGDVYDDVNRAMLTQVRLRDQLKRLAEKGIHSYLVHGNHDPLDGRSHTLDHPQEVYFFGSDVECKEFRKDDGSTACIYGVSYPSREVKVNLAKSMKAKKSAAFHIGLLHCNLDGDQSHEAYAPCSTKDLDAAGMDYWALGHVHRQTVREDPQTLIMYPGNSQGRNIRESGAKGCVLVTVSDKGSVTWEFRETNAARWEMINVDISGAKTEEELVGRIDEELKESLGRAAGRSMAVRLRLEGHSALAKKFRSEKHLNDLRDTLRDSWTSKRPFIWIDEICSVARPEVELESLRKEQTFLGELLRQSEHLRGEPGLKELVGIIGSDKKAYGDRDFERVLGPVSTDIVKSLLMEAEMLCVDNLLEEEA